MRGTLSDTSMTTVPHGRRPGNRLVVFAPNWLGDAVMALPAVADLRRARPDASIVVAARGAIMPLFTLVEEVDDVIDVAGGELRAQEFDQAVLLPNSFHAALTAWRAHIPERWGYRTQGRGALLTRAIQRGPRSHQVAYYQHLVADLGFPNGPSRPRLRISSAVREAGTGLLRTSGWDGWEPLVACAPGAANGRAKMWPTASFAEVARGLSRDGVTMVLVGAPGDAQAGQALVGALGGASSVINLIGRTDLPNLAGALVNCRALVCNDSGAMHFGAALGVSVTAMFGPSNEAETTPRGDGRTVVLTADTWCRPCMLRDCPLDHRCMRAITPESVLAATRESLRVQ